MDLTDRALIEETLAGELSSFDELMRRHERLVYRVSLLYGGTRENALDISQNVFLKCYRSLRAFRGDSAFKTWLLRIAYNEGLSWLRTRRRKGDFADLPADLDGEPARGLLPKESVPDQERGVMERQRREILMQKLDELNPRQRTALTMRYFRQAPLREIADVLQCSEGNVKNMIFRSVRKLRDALAGSGIEGWT